MTTTDAPRAGRREWIGLAVLALACLLYVMDLTVLHLAVPAISESLKPTSAQLLWIIDIYGFTVAGFLVTMGTLGDRIGRRKLLLIGAAAFGVLSGQLPGQLGSAVLDVARDAFVQGMHSATTISAAIALGVALLAVVLLRDVGSGADREAAAEAAGGTAGASTRDNGRTREHERPRTESSRPAAAAADC